MEEVKQEEKKKTPKIYKVIIGIVIFIVVIMLIGSYNSKEDTLKNVSENNQQARDNIQEVASKTESQNNKTYKIGDSAKLGSAIITVNKVLFSRGGAYHKPSEGNEWVNLNITIENTKSSEQYITTLGQMFVRDGESNSYQVASTDKTIENINQMLDGTVIAKSKRTGWVGFEIKEAAKGLQFQYNGSMWGGGSTLFDLGR